MRVLKKRGKVYLDDYFKTSKSRSELIAKFMAVLEMLRQGFVNITDEDLESDDGVIRADGHINIVMNGDVDEARLGELFEDDTAPITVDSENNS